MKRHGNASASLGYVLEELKFLRSPKDLGIFRAKIAYKLPTLGGGLPSRGASRVPPSVQIEPTNLCNLRCVTCPGARSRAPRGYMDTGFFERIVSEAAEIGVKRIHLFLRGEPTLHPKIFEMIAFIKSRGVPLHLTTNGTTLTPERCALLLGTGVDWADQVTVSFLGHSKENHQATMRGIDHDLVVANITELVRLRKELRVNGPVIETILNAPPQTQHEGEDFVRFWTGKVDHARLGDFSLEFQEYGREDAVESVQRTSPCNAIFERLLVFWNGQVPQCNGDFDGQRMLGDLNTDSITDLWNCERLQEARRIHQEGRYEKLPMCLHCDM
jgi:radical SAM protein with 4Fe4S-binding SPASM domain